jgi:CDP-6-deoxy-D-xylo-4-hexulose-3-dehydrase
MRYPLMKNNILREDLLPVIDLLSEVDPQLTAGPRVAEFEDAWSDWLGVKYSVFVNSGSSANLACLAYLKQKFPDGGKVVVPPFTWSSDISSTLWMGFTPLFVDISLNTLGLSGTQVIDQLKKDEDIVAVFLTHAQGLNGLDESLRDYCAENSVFLIEDVCESHGVSLRNGKKAGAHGDLSCFSFYYAHHMSTIEGGMVCTNDEEIYQFLRMLRAHGMIRECTNLNTRRKYVDRYPDLHEKFIFTMPAFNLRNNEIGALIGLSQLRRLDKMVEQRAQNFEHFLTRLPDWIFKDFLLHGQSNYAFNIILNDPDQERMHRLQQTLDQEGIEYRRGSAGGGNQLRQPYVRKLFRLSDSEISAKTPITDHVHFYGMYLGNYPGLSLEDIDNIASIIRRV